MHAQHVRISVQLLASLLHFIIASVSALKRCNSSDTNDGRLNEGWSLHKMYICTFYALFNLTKACGSVLV